MVAGVTACTTPPAPDFTSTALPPGVVGIWYDFTIEVSNDDDQYVIWSIEKGSLPPDLKLDSEKGRIRGTPRWEGKYPLRICVLFFDMYYPDNKDCQDFTLTINPAPKSENK